jgi:hypothetical protein
MNALLLIDNNRLADFTILKVKSLIQYNIQLIGLLMITLDQKDMTFNLTHGYTLAIKYILMFFYEI